MNLQFKEQVWKGQFKATEESASFEDKLKIDFGLQNRYDAARLLIGRSLAEPHAPNALAPGTKFYGKPIPGEHLFGEHLDLWICSLIIDGKLGSNASLDDFRALVEAHWARGYQLLKDDLDSCNGDVARLVARMADFIPDGETNEASTTTSPTGSIGEIKLKVGSASRTHPADKPVEFVLNGQGTSPHIALMGAVGKGKTTTGVQIALELVEKAGIPILFIDPKGEFIVDGQLAGAFAKHTRNVQAIEVGRQPIPLNFLPEAGVGNASIKNAAMKLRDTIALCCKSPGDLQKDLLRASIEQVITEGGNRDLEAVKNAYERALTGAGKGSDSIVSRLNELTGLTCFSSDLTPTEFFSRSWVISLKTIGSEELKRLVILLILDALSSFSLSQNDSPVLGGFRSLRHLLVLDEARKILLEHKYQSLVDLIRQGRSKGSVVMLLSQDPSDFDGQADDFTTQLGTVIAFACAQSTRGLRSLQGVFGRRLQPNEFVDTYLPPGVAFTKLPNREPERIRCWAPANSSK
jgi:hypothetical protein